MSALAAPRAPSLRSWMVVSAIVHVGVAASLILVKPSPPAQLPPMYRVNLIAAPPGPRETGVVQPDQPDVTKAAAKPPEAKPGVEKIKVPVKAPLVTVPKPTTRVPSQGAKQPMQPLPVAGGGPTGGKGADVANVKADGIEFPFPEYLQNVVRRIAMQFKPSAGGALTAEVSFLIRRDGSIASLRVTKRSSVYSFDQDALAAVELASRSFGPLPAGFSDDVLPVIFSFDPRLIR